MLRFYNTEVFGLERAMIASGNSYAIGDVDTIRELTERDEKRARMLGNAEAGAGHDGYLKGIIVQTDLTYPNYWTPEAQRYHWFDIVMSTSKIHCLTKSADQDFDTFKKQFSKFVDEDIIKKVQQYADQYNRCEKLDKYYYFMKTLSNLPLGYELSMTVTTNYLQLKTMFNQRKNHKLKEDWIEGFCEWCLTLPRFSELTGCTL